MTVVQDLEDALSSESDRGRQNAIKVVKRLVASKFVNSDDNLVGFVIDENWTKVTEFFERVQKNRGVDKFVRAASDKFHEQARNLMKLYDCDPARLAGRRGSGYASLSPEPRAARPSKDFRCLTAAFLFIVSLAITASVFGWLFTAASSLAVREEKVQPPASDVRFDLLQRELLEQNKQILELQTRLMLHEANVQSGLDATKAEILANNAERLDDLVGAFITSSDQTIQDIKDKASGALADVSKSAASLVQRIEEGKKLLKAHETRLNNVTNELKANTIGAAVVLAENDKLAKKQDALRDQIENLQSTASGIEGQLRAANENLESSVTVLFYVLGLIFVVCAVTSCWIHVSAMAVTQAVAQFDTRFDLLTASHGTLAERMDTFEFRRDEAETLDPVEQAPAGAGAAPRRRRSGV